MHNILDGTGYKFFLITEQGLIAKEFIEGDGTYKNRNYLFITDKRSAMVEDFSA